MNRDNMGSTGSVAQMLRELDDDGGRPMARTGTELLEHGRRAKRRQRATRAGVAATACAALAIAAPAMSVFGSEPTATAAAAQTYLQETAARVPAKPVTGRFWKREAESYVLGNVVNGKHAPGPSTWVTWTGRRTGHTLQNPDGSRVSEESATRFVFTHGGTPFTWDELTALPGDPAALADALARKAGTRAGSGFDVESDLGALAQLLASPVTPEVRRALLRVASDLGDLRMVGLVTDARGRKGVAIEETGHGNTYRIVVTDDGALLETSVTAKTARTLDAPGIRIPVKAGEVLERTTYLFLGGVNSLD